MNLRLPSVFFLLLGLVPTAALRAAPLPAATAQQLCDALITAMKQGPALGYAGRLRLLTPEIEDAFDLPLMTRLVVGPRWAELADRARAELVAAFTAYSLANYASRFANYDGERFAVDPNATRLPRGDVVVHTKLIPQKGDPVQLDYLMREVGPRWKIIDVFLNGTISELAARRSEYSATLRKEGAAGLAKLLREKAAELGR